MLVDINSAGEFLHKYLKVLSTEQFGLIEDVSLGIKPFVIFSDNEFNDLNKKLEEINRFNYEIKLTASNNNDGIQFEKNGLVKDAVKVYEENISIGRPATHSFDRLMIIYRKMKKYDDEIRVINRAIEIFSKENEQRFGKAYNNPENENLKHELEIGLETCTQVIGNHGWYIFNPYPLFKWSERLTEAIELLQAQKKKNK